MYVPRAKKLGWVVKALGLFRANVIWRALGERSSGEKLIMALSSTNENLRILAGIFLVRGGRKALPLLEKELENRRNLPQILMLLGDIDQPESEEYLRRYLRSEE